MRLWRSKAKTTVFTNTSFTTKKKKNWREPKKTAASEGQDEKHVLYSSFYTSASLPMMHWP